MSITHTTRDLTAEEVETFRRDLLITLGTDARVDQVLRVFVRNGLGIFKAEEA
jgi:hypothetical protein